MTAMLKGASAAPLRRNTRRESRHLAGRFRGGKMVPVGAFAVLGGESASIQQRMTVELDAVAGRLITPVSLRFTMAFVPVEACDALLNADDDYAGVREVIRRKIAAGETLFGLEAESDISKLCGINPRSISGDKKVNSIVRIAYNAAVNYLRQRLYTYATLLTHSNTSVVPALLSATALQRLNGVLDPDDRINGSVNLEIPSMELPVRGITQKDNTNISGGAAYASQSGQILVNHTGGTHGMIFKRKDGNPAGTELDIYAELDGLMAGGVSLTDFYNAEKMDQITRRMREIIEANPVEGEEAVLRWALGLQLEAGKDPVILAQREVFLQAGYKEATDGAGIMDETMISRVGGQIQISQVIPQTELGGIVMCLAEVKPDETLDEQPHPILSDTWGSINQVADELKLDPVKVLQRDLSSSVDTADEAKVAFYTGHNELKRAYVAYGYNRLIDLDQVETKNTVWQYAIPTSVTPENINYPVDLDHYPFLDSLADVVNYSLETTMVVSTPMFFGPTPVETVSIIDDEQLFE